MPESILPNRVSTIQTPPSLREQVVTWLRSALFTGDLTPGSTFSVPALAEQFGISATPVREAVLDLVHHGLVLAVHRKGFVVVDPSAEWIAESVEIRRLLEVPTTCRIAQIVTPEQLVGLRLKASKILAHAHDGNLRGFVEVDYDFHQELTGLCGNLMLTELIEDLRSRARVHTIPYISGQGLLVKTAREHTRLLDAMEARDFADVALVTEMHMVHALASQVGHSAS